MNLRPISRFFGYIMLVGATSVGSVFHARVFPEVVEGAVVLSGDPKVIPTGLQLVQGLGLIHYFLPLLFLVLGAISIRWQALHSPYVTNIMFFVLVLFYLAYTFCLVTPILPALDPVCCDVEQGE